MSDIVLRMPQKAVRMKKQDGFSVWHFQKPEKKNKTVCGHIIADGRGWKMRNPSSIRASKRKQRWQAARVADITTEKNWCKTCLGAAVVEKVVAQENLL